MPVTNLHFVQQEMIRYGMSVYLALGLMGNICDCIMFTRRPYRRTASSIYFLSFSIFAIIYLNWSIFPYLYMLNHIDPQKQILFYCKIRFYGSHILALYLRFLIVFICVDRFLVTQTNVHIRSIASVSMAKKFTIVMCIVCPLISIHVPILMTIQDGVCGMFGLYKLIYAIYETIIIGILPPVLMATFNILTIRSFYQRHYAQRQIRQRDRYLMRMVMVEVMVNIFLSIPYSVNLIYSSATYYVVDKSAQRLEIESFISFVTTFLIYLVGVTPFYLFFLISKPFRNDFINILIMSWNKYILRPVRITPLNVHNNPVANDDREIQTRQ